MNKNDNVTEHETEIGALLEQIKQLKGAINSIRHRKALYDLDYKEYKNAHHTLNEIDKIAQKGLESNRG